MLADMLSVRQAFSGRKDGYVFKMGEQGLGYYSDPLAWDLDAERDRLIVERFGRVRAILVADSAGFTRTAAACGRWASPMMSHRVFLPLLLAPLRLVQS